jgi:hypothetical protein
MEWQPNPYPFNIDDKYRDLIVDLGENTEFYNWYYQDLEQQYGEEFAKSKVNMYMELSNKHRSSKNFLIHTCRLLTSYNKTYQTTDEELWLLDRKLSVFYNPIRNTTRQKQLSLREVGELIKGNKFKFQTEQLRTIANKDEKRAYKANNFCYVTMSGTFSKRADKYLIEHSGLICIDLDHLGSLLKPTRNIIQEDPATVMCFISPSGDGLKVVYEVNHNDYSQADNYRISSNYLTKLCGLPKGVIDNSCKDVSRPCFLPYDPELYTHPQLETYDLSKNRSNS